MTTLTEATAIRCALRRHAVHHPEVRVIVRVELRTLCSEARGLKVFLTSFADTFSLHGSAAAMDGVAVEGDVCFAVADVSCLHVDDEGRVQQINLFT